MAAAPLTVRLAGKDPPAERATSGIQIPLRPCDATASGAEESQVRLARGLHILDLCAHHLAEHELVLLAAGWQITHDNRRPA